MISPQRHLELEMRVIRTVLNRPSLLASVDDLETMDFDNLICRTLWMTIRNVQAQEQRLPESRSELTVACALLLLDMPDVGWDTGYGRCAFELMGDRSHLLDSMPPVIHPKILALDLSAASDASIRPGLVADADTLIFHRKARVQMQDQQIEAAERR